MAVASRQQKCRRVVAPVCDAPFVERFFAPLSRVDRLVVPPSCVRCGVCPSWAVLHRHAPVPPPSQRECPAHVPLPTRHSPAQPSVAKPVPLCTSMVYRALACCALTPHSAPAYSNPPQALAVTELSRLPTRPGPPASAKYDPLGPPLKPDGGGNGTPLAPYATVVVPVRESRSVSATWCFPVLDFEDWLACKPQYVLSQLLAGRAEGSLLWLLKKEGLATTIEVGTPC